MLGLQYYQYIILTLYRVKKVKVKKLNVDNFNIDRAIEKILNLLCQKGIFKSVEAKMHFRPCFGQNFPEILFLQY